MGLRDVNTEWPYLPLASAERPTLVYVAADWSRACRTMAPILREVAQVFRGRVDVVEVDLNDGESMSPSLAIDELPALVLIEKGRMLDRLGGPRSRREIADFLQSFLERKEGR